MKVEDRTVLVTGSNRGIGQALVEEALRRGARRVYAGTRSGSKVGDPRVAPLRLDVTSASDLQRAAGQVEALDVLVNNAGVAIYDDLGDPATIERHLAVNFWGPLNVTRAFLPHLVRAQGAVVNNLSVAALAALPIIPAYSISKAAAFSMTQSLRALLAGRGVSVHAALTGPVDTEMSRGLDAAKASPASVARGIFDGMERGEEDIFPDPMSQSLAESWRTGPVKAFEKQCAALVQTVGGKA